MREVVVTGVGFVTPLGINLDKVWRRLIAGDSGIKKIDWGSDFPRCVGGLVEDFKAEDYILAKDISRMGLFMQYGVAASIEAVQDSRINFDLCDKERIGVLIGSGIGGLDVITETAINFYTNKKKVSPFFMTSNLMNILPAYVSIKYGIKGYNYSVVSACASGANAIGDAYIAIKSGRMDVMIAGASEAAVMPLCVAGFAATKALSTKYNDLPTEASRPWDKGRDGFVMSDGAGIIILEEYKHAIRRGAKIYAKVLGYGITSDAFHITSPDVNGEGATSAMCGALREAGLNPENIDYINAHGTSTIMGDIVELRTVEKLFKKSKVSMSSTKSSMGHLLGAAGSVEIILACLAMRDQIMPPTINLKDPEDTDIDLVPVVQSKKIEHVMSNSFGFGGINVSIILQKI